MNIRLAVSNDVPALMEIICDAKSLLKESGSPQWNVDPYPNEETIINDINQKQLFVISHFEKIIGMIVLAIGIDESYNEIDGSWLTNSSNYLVIHRIALKKEYYHMGISKQLMSFAISYAKSQKVDSIRVDTHDLNKPMQGLLNKYDFSYCGKITLKRPKIDKIRLAYEKIID